MQIYAKFAQLLFHLRSQSHLFSMPKRSSVSDFIRDTARRLRNNLSRDGRARSTVTAIEEKPSPFTPIWKGAARQLGKVNEPRVS